MPFERRPVDKRAEAVLDELEAIARAMEAAERVRAAEAAKRAKLITRARKYGVSLDVIAARLGVTRERVRQIEQGK
jgi:DNA-directed RNA polymerase sigma subunit (sigma70/sigma32)